MQSKFAIQNIIGYEVFETQTAAQQIIGREKGIDGIKVFVDDNSGKAKRVIVQVKSGHVKSGDIRDLVGIVEREGAAIGVFMTLEKATSHMTDEAASAGFFTSEHFGKFPRIQILTVEELLAQVDMPQSVPLSC